MAKSQSKKERWNSYNDIVFIKDGREYRGSYRTDRAKSPGVEVSY